MTTRGIGEGTGRITSLDGLRGVAALVVVFHHLFLVLPQVADLTSAPRVGTATWWFEATPLKLATAGTEAVLIFFVLSGMVVALPALRKPAFDWIAYYPQRLLRLVIPVLASVVFATILVIAHPQVLGARMSWWVADYSFPHPSATLVIGSLDPFLGGNPLNNPLWTLRLELLFSLMLPIFVLVASALRRRWIIALVISSVLVGIGSVFGNASLQYFPVFFAGTLLAVHADALTRWAATLPIRRLTDLAWVGFLVLSLAVLILGWLLWPALDDLPRVRQVVTSMSFLGALGLITTAFLWRPLGRLLSTTPFRWLGRVSFSLYLVHVPIIDAVANVIGPGHWLMIVAISIPAALLCAELFSRFVEQPAHRLAKRLGTALAARFRREQTSAATSDVDAQNVSPEAR